MVALALPCALRGSAALPGHVPGDLSDAGPRGAAVQLALAAALRERGLAGWLADDAHGFPARSDRVAGLGVPLPGLVEAGLAPLGPTLAPWAASLGVAMLGSLGAWVLGRAGGHVRGVLAAAVWCTGAAWLRATHAGDAAALLSMALLPWVACAARGGRLLPAASLAAIASLGTPELAPVAGLAWWVGSDARREGPPTDAESENKSLAATVAALTPLALPLAWWAAARAVPSPPVMPWATTFMDGLPARPVDLEAAASLGRAGVVLDTLARPVLLATAALAWVGARHEVRSLRGTAALAGGALVLALGPVWQVPLVGQVVLPWGLLQQIPGLEGRDAPWVCAVGVSLAVCGLVAREGALPGWRGALLAVGLLAEARVLSPSLPVPSLDLRLDAADAVLARGRGPLLVLPLPGGALRRDRGDLLAQRVHGRPLVNPLVEVEGPWTSHGERALWRDNPALTALLGCEDGRAAPEADAATVAAALGRAGIAEVVYDARVPGSDRALACTAALLQGWQRGAEAPLTWWRPPG